MRISWLFVRNMLGLACLSLATACADSSLAEVSDQLQGRWASAGCEDAGGGYFLQRDFTFEGDHWKDDGRIFSDAGCHALAFDYDDEGAFDVVDASAQIAGAYETDFGEDTRTLTLRSQGLVDYLNSLPAGSCGSSTWVIDQEQSIAVTGCALFHQPSTSQCPKELDLVHIDGDDLYLGDRSGDLCVARPTALAAIPVVRAR